MTLVPSMFLTSLFLISVAAAAAMTVPPPVPANNILPQATSHLEFFYSPTMIWGGRATPVPLVMKCMEERYHKICADNLADPFLNYPDKTSPCAWQVMQSCGGYINHGDPAEKDEYRAERHKILEILPRAIIRDGKVVISEKDRHAVAIALVEGGFVEATTTQDKFGVRFLSDKDVDKILGYYFIYGVIVMEDEAGNGEVLQAPEPKAKSVVDTSPEDNKLPNPVMEKRSGLSQHWKCVQSVAKCVVSHGGWNCHLACYDKEPAHADHKHDTLQNNTVSNTGDNAGTKDGNTASNGLHGGNVGSSANNINGTNEGITTANIGTTNNNNSIASTTHSTITFQYHNHHRH